MNRNETLATAIGAIATLLLFYMVNPWIEPPAGVVDQVVTIAFWVLAIALVLVLYQARKVPGSEVVEVEGPTFTRFLFSNSRAGLLWLPIRLFLGFAWIQSGWGKITEPAWTGGGAALRGYWERAVAIPEAPARPPITFEWYRDFLEILLANNAEGWFAWIVMLGELAVGIALIVGALTGIAAFFGAFMNMSFLLAGTASTNPVMFTLAIGVMLAWRVAGHYGLDRYILPALGTPWRTGRLAAREDAAASTA